MGKKGRERKTTEREWGKKELMILNETGRKQSEAEKMKDLGGPRSAVLVSFSSLKWVTRKTFLAPPRQVTACLCVGRAKTGGACAPRVFVPREADCP